MSALMTLDTDLAWRWGKRGARRRQSRVLRRRIWFGCGNLANRGMLRRKPARTRRSGGKLTWTLDALRAATEPVKEEAMQAIFVGCVLGGVQRTCAGMAQMKPRTRLSYRTADSKRDQYRRGDIKYRALIGANRESPLITRKSRFCLGQLKA